MSKEKVFENNYHGILTHDGWIKVAKFNITARILNIGENQIQVKGNKGKGSYVCNIHKNLKSDVKFMGKDDTVGIKWNCGHPYIVAYRKKNFDNTPRIDTGDFPVHENGSADWISFFKGIDAE